MKIQILFTFTAAMAMLAVGGCGAIAEAAHGSGSQVHQGSHPAGNPHQDFFAKLRLTESQQAKVGALFQKLHTSFAKLFSDKKLTSAQRKVSLVGIHESTAADFKKILNVDQKRQFDEMGGLHGLIGSMMPQMHEALARLDTTEAQKLQLRSIFSSTVEAAKAIKGNAALSPKQRGQKLNEQHLDAMVRLHEVLTPEQLEKLHGAMGHHGGQ